METTPVNNYIIGLIVLLHKVKFTFQNSDETGKK